MQDFPVFLAHCRVKLPGNTFTALNEVFGREVLTDQWLTRSGLAIHHNAPVSVRHTRAFGARLTFYLCDHRIGPSPTRPTPSYGSAQSKSPCSCAATSCATSYPAWPSPGVPGARIPSGEPSTCRAALRGSGRPVCAACQHHQTIAAPTVLLPPDRKVQRERPAAAKRPQRRT